MNVISENNTIIRHTTLGDGIKVADDCLIMDSILGDHCDIDCRNRIISADIGRMTYTGADTSAMWCRIGSFCCISRLVDIGGNEHNYLAASMMPAYRIKSALGKGLAVHHKETPIVIGSDVWIGSGAAILRKEGLTVGDGAVIGSGAVVTKSVPPYAVVAGVPARIIRYRFEEDVISRLLALKWWDWEDEKIYTCRKLLSRDLTDEVLTELEKMAGTGGNI